MPIGKDYMVGYIPGTDIHWGLVAGIVLAIALQVLMTRTTFGFAARVTGGNARAALAQGLPVGTLVVACTAIAGACAGLGRLFRGRGHPRPGECIAGGRLRLHRHPDFLSGPAQPDHDPAGRGHVRRDRGVGWTDPAPHGYARRHRLVLQGIIFVVLLASETLYGRFAIFQQKAGAERT
jgi:hypothetical protein